jgi:uncharacterized membrane protein
MSAAITQPTIRRISLTDVRAALREGYDDFRANPTHLIFLCLIYPVMGLLLGRMASGSDSLPLIYPLIGGFALIGPLASVGLYELSRRREQGQTVSVSNALDIFASHRLAAILMLGVAFVAIFLVWLGVAQAIFDATMPAGSTESIGEMFNVVTTTTAGWRLMIVGTGVGLVFAIVALTIGVVSFPLLVDRDLGGTSLEQAVAAIRTSVAATKANPVAVAAWGLIVAASLAISVATLLVGLAVLMPILGHATWHLYRKLVA